MGDSAFASASRDGTVKIWQRLDGSPDYAEMGTFTGHTRFVNSLAYMKPSAQFPTGLVVSGGSDKLIFAFDPFDPLSVVYTLIGHGDNICCLATTDSGEIASGSWDKYSI